MVCAPLKNCPESVSEVSGHFRDTFWTLWSPGPRARAAAQALMDHYVLVSSSHQHWEMRNIYHHHPESKKRKSSEANSGSIHPYGRYENAVKTRKTISTIAILWPVKAIFEKRAATVEVDILISPVRQVLGKKGSAPPPGFSEGF